MVQIHHLDSDGEADAVGEYSTDEDQEPTTALATIPDNVPKGSIKMTPKIPPTFDGQGSWFEFEDLIDDWVGITTLPQEKLGPSLKNSLVGAAEYYKNMLDNSLLRDPDSGITHFKDILRPYFVKGVNHVFLWRFMRLFRPWRGHSGELVQWIARFEVASKRVLTAWMDLFDPSNVPDVNVQEFPDFLTDEEQTELRNIRERDARRERARELRETVVNREKFSHKDKFPISDNLMSLIFLVQADLGEQQRERFVASMSLRQIDMQGYTYLRVKQLFLELFCSTATSTADPLIRRRKRITFLVLDEGEYEEETGYWVMDQATQEEGFVSLFSETEFWVLGAKGGYTKRKIHGRKFRKGPKGGKGNRGKGRKRPGFRSRRGKGAFASPEEVYDWDWNNSNFYGKGGKGKGKGKGQGKWHFPQKGKRNDAYKGNYKGRGKGKNNKGDAANVAQGSHSQEPSQAQAATNAAEEDWSGWHEAYPFQEVWYQEGNTWYNCSAEEAAMWNPGFGYFAHGWTDQTDQETAGQRNPSQETGSATQDLPHRHFDDFERNSSCEPHSSFLNYDNCSHHALLSEYIDLRRNPTYVILDSGCARAMGSKYAIDRLVRACQNHPNADLVYFTRAITKPFFICQRTTVQCA